MATQGTTTVDFGAGATDASASVASASIGASNLVEAWVFPADTASNTADNHWVDDIRVMAGAVVAGVGFTIYAKCQTGLAHGVFNVGWVWN